MSDSMIQDISNMLHKLARECPGASFKSDFDQERGCMLVSYSIPEGWDDDNIFWDKLFDIKSILKTNYPDNPPLFCQDERLFSLTDNALRIDYGHETICCTYPENYQDFVSDQYPEYEFILEDGMDKFPNGFIEYSLAA